MFSKIYRNLRNQLAYLIHYRTKNIFLGSNVSVYESILEGKNRIYDNTVFIRSKLGKGSYIGCDGVFNDAEIGKYCSFGNRIKIVSYTHPTKKFVSTHPAFFSLSKQAGFTYTTRQSFQEQQLLNRNTRVSVSIGNDVWMGDEVMIMGGVKINDGAIIAARSLVTKEVAPYTIVGGVPAKEIGKRFNDSEIEFLLNLRWWDKDEEWITNNVELFWDITQFILKTKE
jgi:acetyltransferase-like isoleucine patch superfamily enzyme